MLHDGVPTCNSAQEAAKMAKPFGGKEERDWLDEYFRPGGGPAGKPYYMPGTEVWVINDIRTRRCSACEPITTGTPFITRQSTRGRSEVSLPIASKLEG
jgi:hypothetical protein